MSLACLSARAANEFGMSLRRLKRKIEMREGKKTYIVRNNFSSDIALCRLLKFVDSSDDKGVLLRLFYIYIVAHFVLVFFPMLTRHL